MAEYRLSYQRMTITPTLRDWLLQRFQVEAGTPEWSFLHYALLGTSRDPDGLPLSRGAMAAMEGRDPDSYYVQHIYTTASFRERVQTAFPELEIGWLEHTAGRATTLLRSIPGDVAERLAVELSTLLPESERVYFTDGTQIDRHKKASLRRNQLARAERINVERAENATETGRLIVGYLNGLPSHQFTKILDNMSTAQAAIQELEPKKRSRELCILEVVSLQPQPFYCYSRRSARVTPIDTTIASLKTPIRRALTEGWIEADLQNVQLAINARLWNLPGVQAFLATGKSWWQELFDWLGMEPDADIKKRLKRATYALCYGAEKATIREDDVADDGTVLEEGLGPLTDRFWNYPLVEEIRDARSTMFGLIMADGGMHDAEGRWIALNSALGIGKRSILAQVGQSYEQVLIAEAFKLAQENRRAFSILLYQADGVSLHFTDFRRQSLWLGRLQKSVAEKAQELGIQTALVIQD